MDGCKSGIRIGTRGSRLALIQAKLVQAEIEKAWPGIGTELVVLQTRGDKIQDRPLSEIGDKGVFASALERALLEKRIDLAVHSAKDLPMHIAPGLVVTAALPRADVREMLVVKKGAALPKRREEAADGSAGENAHPKRKTADAGSGVRDRTFVLGTGSKRRQTQAQARWENVRCELIRGNVDTRLKKLADGAYDGILLAKAGLDRLGICAGTENGFDFYPLPAEEFLPAACQGILAVECRADWEFSGLQKLLADSGTALHFHVEREVLRLLGADCSEAAAAWCRASGCGLCLDVMYGGRRARVGTAQRSREAGLSAAKEAAERVRSG